MGFTLNDETVDVEVPNKKVRVKKSNVVNTDFDFTEGFRNVMKAGDKKPKNRNGLLKEKPIRKGVDFISKSTKRR